MIVAGGVYRESCITPPVDAVFGSGGRAAVALARAGHKVLLHTFCPVPSRPIAKAALEGAGIDLEFHDSAEQPFFRYLHPLAKPVVFPWPNASGGRFSVSGDTVLRFGMMEGDAVVSAACAIFDPQSPSPTRFRANGSSADRLAIVSNRDELRTAFPNSDEAEAAAALATAEGAQVVVVKAGAVGACVYEVGQLAAVVPPYVSRNVYKIGSGDIFSAAFAHAWGLQKVVPAAAADFASRSVAQYCETRDAGFAATQERDAITYKDNRRVYLAAPFFTVADLWLIEEAVRCLVSVGAQVFSPYHEVGLGEAATVAKADLAALDKCDAVLAVLSGCDPGTLFEVGYAIKSGKPVVALIENSRPADGTMFVGSGCELTSDLSTAVYKAAWASWR